MTRWIFLRHAESRANAEGWLSGWDDVELTEAGVQQARAAADRLAGYGIGRVLASDLQRAWRTAELAMGALGVPIHRVPDLRERHMGVLQGQPRDAVRADGRHARWLTPWEVGPPGGESHAVAVRRAVAALRHWDDGTTTLVVAHGSLLRGLIGMIDGLSPDDVGAMAAVGNAEPVERVVSFRR
ncbi:MAG: histidine phosphatase family protein [Myxococcota bacterium]